jgi:hypothetical protein
LVAYIKSNEGKISIYNLTDKKEIFQTDSTKIGLFDGQIRQTPTGYRILVSHSPDNQNYTNTILTISTRATTTPTQETKINDNQQAILSPDGNSVFYLHEDVSGVFGILKSLTTGQEKEIFRSPLSTWTLAWPNKDTITLQTKPGRGVDGYFYTLSTTGVLTSILNKTDSLVAKMSPDGKKVIYNKLDNTLSTYIYDIEKKTSYKLAIKTIVDKCSWFGNEKIYCLAPREALTENSLEDWYKGKTSFTDDLWTINADTKNAQKVGSLPTKLDGYNLFINSGETTAFTTNKLDGSVVMIPIQ